MDREAWWATVHGVIKSWTRLSNQTHTVSNTVLYTREKRNDPPPPNNLPLKICNQKTDTQTVVKPCENC